MFVECMLKVLQSSVFSQSGQARCLQGPTLRGLSDDGRVECFLIAAVEFLPPLRREGFGVVFLVNMRRIATAVAATVATHARWATRCVDHQDLCRRIAAVTLGQCLDGASRQIEQAVERFIGLNCRNLRGGRLTCHSMLHPPLKPRSTGSLATANSGERRRCRSRPILGRRLPQKDAADTRAKVRRPADEECLDV
jgi:hypothetical protein